MSLLQFVGAVGLQSAALLSAAVWGHAIRDRHPLRDPFFCLAFVCALGALCVAATP